MNPNAPKKTIWRKIHRVFNKIFLGGGRRVLYKLDRVKWWILHHTTHRYHVLKIADKANGYTYGWRDTDERLMLASFKLLCDYVENEMDQISWEVYTPEGWDEPINDGAPALKDEIMFLYNWWKIERPAFIKEYWTNRAVEEWDKMYDQETEMLIRLAKIRRVLWS